MNVVVNILFGMPVSPRSESTRPARVTSHLVNVMANVFKAVQLMIYIQYRVVLARAIIQWNGIHSCLVEILCRHTHVGIHQKSTPRLVEFRAGRSFEGISVQDRDIDGLLFFDDGISYRC